MTKHLPLCYTQNTSSLSLAKKESVFIRPYLLKGNASAFLKGASKTTSTPLSLVYIRDIKKNKILPNIQWYRLNKISRLFYTFIYAEQKHYYAISIRFSHNFINRIINDNHKADFIRRRINANFKLYNEEMPEYSFVLEEDKTYHIHLHGIMKIKNTEKTKHILKLTCFGSDYKNSSFNKFIYHYQPLCNAGKWCAYCLKGKFAKGKNICSYTSRNLSRAVKFEYDTMKGIKTDEKKQ